MTEPTSGTIAFDLGSAAPVLGGVVMGTNHQVHPNNDNNTNTNDGTFTPYGSSENNSRNHRRNNNYRSTTITTTNNTTNGNDDDDDQQDPSSRPVGVEHLPPRQLLSGVTVAQTFNKLLRDSSTDKDIFAQNGCGESCSFCCNATTAKFFFPIGIFFIIASIVVIILIAMGKIPIGAVVGPIYGFIAAAIFICFAIFMNDSIYEVDKREQVIRTKNAYTFLKCWNNVECAVEAREIRFEDVDYVSVEGVRDGFFDEDYVEVKNEDYPAKSEDRYSRVPVKAARRKFWKEDQEKKRAAATTSIPVNEKGAPPPGSSQKQLDKWLRAEKYFRPQGFDDENPDSDVAIRLYRRGLHSEVYENNKVKYPKGVPSDANSSVLLEKVAPSRARERLADWEAYLASVGVPHLRRSVPWTKSLPRRLMNPYDTEVEEIQTSSALKSSKLFWCIMVPSIILYIGFLALIVVFAKDANARAKEEEAAWNQTLAGPNATRPTVQPDLYPYQFGILGGVGVGISMWVGLVIWWFMRKVVLIVDKRTKRIHYKMSRYFCKCSCLDDSDLTAADEYDNSEQQVKEENKAAESNDSFETSFKFEQIHSIQMKLTENGRALSDRCVKIFYYPKGYTAANYNPKKLPADQLPPLRSVIIATMTTSCSNPVFRAWKRYFLEDLKIPLNHQPEDVDFAELRRQDGEVDERPTIMKKNGGHGHRLGTKELDADLYVQEQQQQQSSQSELEDKSPLIHS